MQPEGDRVPRLKIVILGLSLSSSWGNGHATAYRALVRELDRRGHDVLFLERDVPWYAAHRDLARPPWGRFELYTDLDDLRRFASEVRSADFVLVGSYVPEGVAAGRWALSTAMGPVGFYDIDTPVTLAKLAAGDEEYVSADLVPLYAIYLSFTGGPTLQILEERYGSPRARALYCSADSRLYYPEEVEPRWDLGYMGTYAADRQPGLEALLLEPARRWAAGRFVVAGPQYPETEGWPTNVSHVEHLAPPDHRRFYCAQRFTLNLTRADMRRAGFSPSVRLFEAAACGVPIISDLWPGLETLFEPGREVLTASGPEEVLQYLKEMPDGERVRVGERARRRVLAAHTSAHRARELEQHVLDLIGPSCIAYDTARAGAQR